MQREASETDFAYGLASSLSATSDIIKFSAKTNTLNLWK